MAKYSPTEYAQLDMDALALRIDYGFLDYQVDVFHLAEAMGIKLFPYSDLNDKQRSHLSEKIAIDDGFTISHSLPNGNYDFIIYFNDEIPIRRQRFTIAHEIKHIVYLELKPTEKDERLADHFARALLVPSCLVVYLMENHNILELQEIFNVSLEAMSNALSAANNRVLSKGNILNQYEIDFLDSMESLK